MTKKWILMIILIVLLTGCAKTKVVRYDQSNALPSIQQIEEQITNQNTIQQNILINNPINSTDKETMNIQEDTEETADKIATQTLTSDSSNEYVITSCCNEGRLHAQTKKPRTSYTTEDIKRILLDIYHSNCDKFDNVREMIYLRYSDEEYDSCYLQHYKNTSVKKILMDGNLISDSFTTCS